MSRRGLRRCHRLALRERSERGELAYRTSADELFASKYVRMVTGFKVHDTTAGFKCYKRRVLETIELDKIRFKGYGFQIEMKLRHTR